jgi:hypothetical protein
VTTFTGPAAGFSPPLGGPHPSFNLPSVHPGVAGDFLVNNNSHCSSSGLQGAFPAVTLVSYSQSRRAGGDAAAQEVKGLAKVTPPVGG